MSLVDFYLSYKPEKYNKPIYTIMKKNAIVAELGVAIGGHSKLILDHTKPTELHLIDSWTYNDKNYKYPIEKHKSEEICIKEWQTTVNKFKNNENVTVHRNNCVDAAKKFKDGYFDWIYIDAGHRYECVYADLESWYPKVKKGGVIVGHDYTKLLLGTNKMEVQEAVNDWCKKYNLTPEVKGWRALTQEYYIQV